MRNFVESLVGGIVIIALASVLGVVHNALRADSIKLIQKVPPAPAIAASDDPAGGGTPAPGTEGEMTLAEGEISVQEMKRIYDEGFTVIIDARGLGEFAEGHIPGAINIPYDELPSYLETLQLEAPVDQPVVCYCRGPLCDLSHSLATELRLMGYQDVKVFKGGWEHWTEAGHPVNEGTEP